MFFSVFKCEFLFSLVFSLHLKLLRPFLLSRQSYLKSRDKLPESRAPRTSLVASVLLSVAVVVDDSVNHVARPIDVGLVAHHRDVVLAVLVALLIYLHRHPAAVLDLANLVASAADDEFDLVGVHLEGFGFGCGRVDPGGSPRWSSGAASVAESAATGSTAGTVSAAAATTVTASVTSAATARAVSAATSTSVSAAASAAVVTALPVVTGTTPAVPSAAALRIVAFPPIRHGSVVGSRLNCHKVALEKAGRKSRNW